MKPRVVLVMVECACDDASVARVELAAAQWAQDVRFRRVLPHAETSDARSVVLSGSLSTLREMLTMAAENLA